MKKTFLFLLTSAALAACQTPVAERGSATPELPDVVAQLARDGSPVVGVAANVARRQPMHDAESQWLDTFFPRVVPLPGSRESMRVLQNIGAGIIISADGLILTNAHVVAGASGVSVYLADGRLSYSARVLGVDRVTDLALLKVDATDLPTAALGRSGELRDGEWVAAVGAPGELPAAASAGIVRAQEGYLIPFDRIGAVPTPVSSGPLVNARGEVVGISTGVVASPARRRGTGVAVPIEIALDVARHLRAYGEVRRERAGVRS